MKLILLAPLLIVSLLVPALSPAQGEKVNLLPKWQVGKRYVLTQKMDTVTEIPVPNMKGEQKIHMDMTMEMRVTEKGPDEKQVAMSFTGMNMKMEMAGQNMEFDASDPAHEQMMGGILDVKPVFIYDRDDQFLRMEGLENMAKGPMAKMAEPGMLKQIVNGSIEAMPREPVAVGHEWEQEIAVPVEGAGDMKVKAKYKFDRMEMLDGANCAVVVFSGNLSGAIKAQEGLQMSFEDGLFTGTMHMDPEIGYMRKSESRNRLVMKMKLPGQEEEMLLPMDQTQTVTLTTFEDIE